MYKKLDIKAVAIAIGLMWSVAILLVSIVAGFSQTYLHNIVEFLSSIYIGYDLSFAGVIIGMTWGFADAGIGGVVFAWIYNKLAK